MGKKKRNASRAFKLRVIWTLLRGDAARGNSMWSELVGARWKKCDRNAENAKKEKVRKMQENEDTI